MARIWILGGGLIGCGWAAAFAGAGHDVTVIDPDPAVADRIATVQAQALPVLQGLGSAVAAPCSESPRASQQQRPQGQLPRGEGRAHSQAMLGVGLCRAA